MVSQQDIVNFLKDPRNYPHSADSLLVKSLRTKLGDSLPKGPPSFWMPRSLVGSSGTLCARRRTRSERELSISAGYPPKWPPSE